MTESFDNNLLDIELICVVTNYGWGSKVLKISKKNGVTGGTVLLGRGTVKNRFLEFLSLNDIRREIVLMVTEKNIAIKALEAIYKELKLHKPYNGIAFSISVDDIIGIYQYNSKNIKKNRGEENIMYNCIFVVVDKGKGEEVMEAAIKGGSTGGTIINGRGSGIHETNIVFHMPIEPEKEVVMILAKKDITDNIVSSIREDLKIDDPGKGIMFVLNVNKTYGLYEE